MQQDRATLASDACQRQASPRRTRLLSGLRMAARLCILGLLLAAVLLVALFLLLQRHQQDFTDKVLASIASATGMQVAASSVDVILLPVPSATVSHLRLSGRTGSVQVAYATLRPDFSALLTGDLAPGHVELLRPQVEGSLPLESLLALPPAPAAAASPLPALPWSCTLDIRQGHADLRAGDGSRLVLDNLDCSLRLHRDGSLKGQLSWDNLTLHDREGLPQLAARAVRMHGQGNLQAPLQQPADISLLGSLSCGHWLRQLNSELRWQQHDGQRSLHARLHGSLIQNGQAIPLSLAGRMLRPPAKDAPLTLHDLQLALDQDSGVFNGTLHLQTENGPRLDGTLRMQHLSLTRWLGFARDLAPGLQWALDDLTGVSVRFQLDAQGLRAPHVAATAAGSAFSGTGGVASWKQPVVALDLHAPQVSLGRAIPESVGQLPDAPRYAYAPLTSFDPRPEAWDPARQRSLPPSPPPDAAATTAGGTDNLGYDIRLGADAVQYGPLDLHQAQVVITPGKPASTGRGRANIDVQTTTCAGSIRGQAVIGGGPDKTEFDIALQARDLQAAALGKRLPLLPLRDGRLAATVDVHSRGSSIPAFMTNLSGKAGLRATGGSLRAAPSALQRFSSLTLDLDLHNGRWKQGRAGLDGAWTLAQTGQGYAGSARLDGILWLGGRPRLALDDARTRLRLTTDAGLFSLPHGLELTADGQLSAQASPPGLRLEQARLRALDAAYAGSLRLTADKALSLQGTGSLRCPDLARTVELVTGKRPPLPAALKSVELAADMDISPQTLQLRNVSTRLLDTALSGQCRVAWRNPPHLQLQLHTPRLDLDRVRRLLDPQGAAAAERAEAAQREAIRRGGTIPPDAPTPQGPPWDLRFMQTFSAEGSLTVAQLASWRVRLDDITLPFRLAGGRLDYGPVTARFYGAPLHSTGHVQFDRGLRFENSLSVDNFNLGAASAARGGKTALFGLATVRATLSAALTASGQMPRQLNGHWQFTVRDGAYQNRREDGSPKGSPTRFSLVSGSGTLQHGVARSSNLTLRSQEMDVTGGGWIDLNSEMLDCTLHVNTPRLSDIPVRVHGSLHQPQTSIGAGTVLLYALSGITQGLIDIISGLLEGTWRILR